MHALPWLIILQHVWSDRPDKRERACVSAQPTRQVNYGANRIEAIHLHRNCSMGHQYDTLVLWRHWSSRWPSHCRVTDWSYEDEAPESSVSFFFPCDPSRRRFFFLTNWYQNILFIIVRYNSATKIFQILITSTKSTPATSPGSRKKMTRPGWGWSGPRSLSNESKESLKIYTGAWII